MLFFKLCNGEQNIEENVATLREQRYYYFYYFCYFFLRSLIFLIILWVDTLFGAKMAIHNFQL